MKRLMKAGLSEDPSLTTFFSWACWDGGRGISRYAVVVVAEGAGEEILGTSAETDAGGNKKLPKIGEFMKARVEEYFKKQGDVATVKYIDPSYTVRSVPANAADSLCKCQI